MAEKLANIGYLAMVKEATAGTVPSTPSIYVPLFDENIQQDHGLTEDISIFGNKAKTYQILPGRRSILGSFTVTGEPNTAAHLANMLLTQGTPSGAGPYTYPFTLSSTNPKSYTIDVAKGSTVHRYMGVQASKMVVGFNNDEMQLTMSVSALSSFIEREISTIATTTLTLTSTYSDYSTTPTTGLVTGDLVSIISATNAVPQLDTTVASITNGTTVVLGASAAAFSPGDMIVIRPATAPTLATVTPFLWARSEFRFSTVNAAGALTATHTPLEIGSAWEIDHIFNDDKGEWRSGSFLPVSLIRKTGTVAMKVKKFFDTPNDMNQFQKNAKNALVCRHFSETGYELRLTINNFKWKNVIPKMKVGDIFYSEMEILPQYDSSDAQMFDLKIINNLSTV